MVQCLTVTLPQRGRFCGRFRRIGHTGEKPFYCTPSLPLVRELKVMEKEAQQQVYQ